MERRPWSPAGLPACATPWRRGSTWPGPRWCWWTGPPPGEAAARLGAQGAPVHGVQGDLSHWEGIPALYDRALAALGGRGVNVNAIAPGYMVTQLTADMQGKNPAQYAEITGRIPMHRWGQPEDLQGAVVFLASPAAAYVTGAILPVDGGYLGK